MLPDGWKVSKIDDIATVYSGGTPSRSKPEFYDGDIPWVKSGEVNQVYVQSTEEKITEAGFKNSSARWVPANSVLVAMYGATAGKVGFLEIDATINQAILAVLGKEGIATNRYLFFSLQAITPELLNRCQGSGQPNLSGQLIKGLEIPLPPLPEQQKIAEILSSVDDAIARTQAVIDQTRKVKQGLLQQLLTRGIGHTKFKETPIGQIPESWRLGTIGDFFELQRGFDITQKQVVPGKIPVISSSGISYYHNQATAQPPGVLTGRKGKLGHAFFVSEPYWAHDTTLWVKNFKGNLPKYIFWFLLKLNLEKLDAATACPTLNRNVVHSLPTAFPPIHEQEQITAHLDDVEESLYSSEKEIKQLQMFKQGLMQDLLTGRVRVAV